MVSFLGARRPITAGHAVGQRFPYPLRPAPKIAVFSSHFLAEPGVVIGRKPEGIQGLGVASAAAPMRILRRLADGSWQPTHPLVALSGFRDGSLSSQHRDEIWTRFGVPVFEYLLDTRGQIVARECEAHDGLHLLHPVQYADASYTDQPCPCGTPGIRMRTLRTPQPPEAIIEEYIPTANGAEPACASNLAEAPAGEPLCVASTSGMWRNWQTHWI